MTVNIVISAIHSQQRWWMGMRQQQSMAGRAGPSRCRAQCKT